MYQPGAKEAVILAGGKGTRLKRIVKDRPKPMAVVAGRPFLERLVHLLYSQGFHRIIFSSGFMAEVIEAHFGDGSSWQMEFEYSVDPFPLGTAGAVRHALSNLYSERFIVLNGDSYCPVDTQRLEKVHSAAAARATLWLVRADDCSRFGSVDLSPDGTVRAFHEKAEVRCPGVINAGIYMLERDAVATIPEGVEVSLEKELFPSLIGHGLYGVIGEQPFLDIGTPEAYASAERFFALGN